MNQQHDIAYIIHIDTLNTIKFRLHEFCINFLNFISFYLVRQLSFLYLTDFRGVKIQKIQKCWSMR